MQNINKQMVIRAWLHLQLIAIHSPKRGASNHGIRHSRPSSSICEAARRAARQVIHIPQMTYKTPLNMVKSRHMRLLLNVSHKGEMLWSAIPTWLLVVLMEARVMYVGSVPTRNTGGPLSACKIYARRSTRSPLPDLNSSLVNTAAQEHQHALHGVRLYPLTHANEMLCVVPTRYYPKLLTMPNWSFP